MNIIDSYFNDDWLAREGHIRQFRGLLDEFPLDIFHAGAKRYPLVAGVRERAGGLRLAGV